MIYELGQLFRAHFRRAKNGFMQIILLNVLSFGGLLLLKTSLVLVGKQATYTALWQSLALPGSWASYVQQPWTLLTYSWLHTSFWATLWGLSLLYVLGQVVVNLIGNRHFLALYMLGGLGGGGLFLVLYQLSPYLRDTPVLLFGFSGSLYAIMMAAATLAPQLTFSFLLLGPVRLRYLVGFLVLLALADLSGGTPADSIAQLGGALLGYLYVKQLYGHPRLGRYWQRLWGKKSKLKVSYRRPDAAGKRRPKTNIHQDHLDRILDKVAESGYQSLSAAEKQQLFEAGQ